MKKLESGRSMVEMLGVLAIIGVLSIGGIAGYTMAMNRYKANEVINAAAMVSVANLSSQGTDAIGVGDLGLGTTTTNGTTTTTTVHGCTISGTAQSAAVSVTCTDTKISDAIENITGGKGINADGKWETK